MVAGDSPAQAWGTLLAHTLPTHPSRLAASLAW